MPLLSNRFFWFQWLSQGLSCGRAVKTIPSHQGPALVDLEQGVNQCDLFKSLLTAITLSSSLFMVAINKVIRVLEKAEPASCGGRRQTVVEL